MTIEQLNLSPAALKAAQALAAACPGVQFTSGRRSLISQARAMSQSIAAEIAKNGSRRWIAETYLPSPVCSECQAWMDENLWAKQAPEIAQGLNNIFVRMPISEVSRISKHLSGDAFDVQPLLDKDGKVTPQGLAVIAAIKALPGLTKFLDHEGGLVRWHAQF